MRQLCSPPDPPEVIKQALLQLRKQQGNSSLCIHTDDALAGSQCCVSYILILISQSLNTHAQRERVNLYSATSTAIL